MSHLSFEPLDFHHQEVIDQFQCDDEPVVELFLKEQALSLHMHDSAKTRLYFDEQRRLVGFFTLFNDHVRMPSSKIEQQNWSLPDLDWFPAINLHYLGVDSRFRNLGYGRHLLFEIVKLCGNIVQDSGCNFLTVESLYKSASFYEKFGFTRYRTTKTYVRGTRVSLTELAMNLKSLHSAI